MSSGKISVTELEKPEIKTQEQIEEEKKKAEAQTAIIRKKYEKEIAKQEERKKNERKTDESRIKILLLGAKHLASHLVFAMRNHATFTVIDRVDPEYIYQNPLVKQEVARRLINGYQISEFDIERNLIKILEDNEFDFVINTISLHDAAYSAMNPTHTMFANTVYTQSIMNAIVESRKYNPNLKIVHISSDKVYGDVGCPAGLNNDSGPEGYWKEFMIDEKETPNPLGMKAISRLNQEIIVRQMCKTYDLDCIIFRVGNLWGRYTSRTNMLNNMIITGIREKRVHIYGDPWASRHLLNIEDFSEFIRDLLNKNYDASKWNNNVYNVGGHCPLRQYVWGYAMWSMSMLSGNQQKDLDPKADYFMPYGTVKVQNNAPRWFEDTEEAKIRIWLNTKKVEEQLGYVGARDIRWDLSYKELMLFNAAYYVGYSMDQINDARSKITYSINR